MEDTVNPVSVKAMMGRFEQITREPENCRYQYHRNNHVDASKVQIPSSLEKINNNFSNFNSKSCNDLNESSCRDENSTLFNENEFLNEHDQIYETVHDPFCKKNNSWTKVGNRSRYNSVGSLISHNDKEQELNFTNNNFNNSFSEKQKLVENIVKNIKNSGKNVRETIALGKDEQKCLKMRPTTKLEKDLKNALEKGVRKFSVKRRKDKNQISELDSDSKNYCPRRVEYNITDAKNYNLKDEIVSTTPKSSNIAGRKYIDKYESLSSHPLMAGGHYPRSLHLPSLQPVRPPRRKSPKKHLNQISESINKNDESIYSCIEQSRIANYASPLPDGEPPRKPPRTFAHDIYMRTKKEHTRSQHQTPFQPEPPGGRFALTQKQIEALYAKPIKKNKQKSNDVVKHDRSLTLKPEVAPKPSTLVHIDDKKRFSVVESNTNQKEFSEAKKSAVRRNSSFRFNFRKPIQGSTYLGFSQPQPSPKRGHLFEKFAANLQHKKDYGQRKVKFSQRSKSDEVIYDEAKIYATPNEKKIEHPQNDQELHYMCSPLFTEDDWSTDSEEPLPSLKFDDNDSKPKVKDLRTKFGLDGLRKEWRQSYRFVQKRLKNFSPAR